MCKFAAMIPVRERVRAAASSVKRNGHLRGISQKDFEIAMVEVRPTGHTAEAYGAYTVQADAKLRTTAGKDAHLFNKKDNEEEDEKVMSVD